MLSHDSFVELGGPASLDKVSDSKSTSSTSDRSSGTATESDPPNTVIASSSLRLPNIETASTPFSPNFPEQQDAALASGRVEELLRAILDWTNSSGDTSVVSWLVGKLKSLHANPRGRPGEPDGRDSPVHYSTAAIALSQGRNSSGSSTSSSSRNENDSTRGDDSSSKSRLKLKTGSRSQVKRARLRCPFFFSEEGHRCHALHIFIRDLV